MSHTLSSTVAVSVIVPVEEDVDRAEEWVLRTVAALDRIVRSFEIILCGVGLERERAEALCRAKSADPRVIVRFRARSTSRDEVIRDGFRLSGGAVVLVAGLDASLDPCQLASLLAPIKQGTDVVSGVRVSIDAGRVRRALALAVGGVRGMLGQLAPVAAYRRHVLSAWSSQRASASTFGLRCSPSAGIHPRRRVVALS